MLAYFIVFFLLIFSEFIKRKNLYCFIVLLIFMAIRFNVGSDFETYFELAKRWNYFSLSLWKSKIVLPETFDYIFFQYYRFELLNKILYKITWFFKEPQLIIFLYSVILLIGIKKGLDYKKINSSLPWIIFYTFPVLLINFLSTMRQGVAVGLCFFSCKYIEKKELKKFIVVVFIAFLFHKTALIFFISYFLRNIELNKIKGMILICFSIFGKNIIIKTASLLGIYSGYFSEEHYIRSGSKFIYIMLIFWILFMFLAYSKKDFYNKNKIPINIYFVGMTIYISFLPLGLSSLRVASYFIIYILYIILEFKKFFYQRKIIFCLIVVLCGVFLCFNLWLDLKKSTNTRQLIPYRIYFLEGENKI